MTDEYTPNTGHVKRAYVQGMRQAFIASAGEHEAEFERWLEVQQMPLKAVRAEYDRYLEHHDVHELARAIGQILED